VNIVIVFVAEDAEEDAEEEEDTDDDGGEALGSAAGFLAVTSAALNVTEESPPERTVTADVGSTAVDAEDAADDDSVADVATGQMFLSSASIRAGSASGCIFRRWRWTLLSVAERIVQPSMPHA